MANNGRVVGASSMRRAERLYVEGRGCDHILEIADELSERGQLREDAGRVFIPG